MLFAKAIDSIKCAIRARRDTWIARRHPPQASHTIDKRRIYILPTVASAGFILMLMVLLLLAINYENNLIYALTFLLVGVLLVSMIHTHENLRGLTLSSRGSESVYAGQKSRYRLHLAAPSHPVVGLNIKYPEGDSLSITLAHDEERTVEVSAAVSERGLHQPGVLRISSSYPMGLFSAWSYVDLGQSAWIYPRPVPGGQLPLSANQNGSGAQIAIGNEEFSGLNDYHPGMSLNRVAWSTLAKGMPLQVKEFVEEQGETRWLRWSFWPELSQEARLSRLCDWVLKLDRENKAFGLELPHIKLDVASGPVQLKTALQALAQYGVVNK